MAPPSDSRLISFYLSAMHDLGRALQSEPLRAGSGKPLRESLYRILGTFAVGRGALLVANEEGTRLELAAAKGLRGGADLQIPLPSSKIPARKPGRKSAKSAAGSKGAASRRLASASRPFRPNLPPSGLEALAAAISPTLERLRLQWIVPLATGASFVGLLLLGERLGRRPLGGFELEVLEEMGSLLALRIDDARNRRRLAEQLAELEKTHLQMRQIFLETVRALAGVIDGPAPGGGPTHSARVASLASEIARRLKLPAEACERLYVAGLLHDVGKQVIHQDILGKSASLTDDERIQIERHPAAASELIGHIRFPWGDVAEIIRHHHERLDGRGYPDRLAGEQISLEARILMMAEAFDSMASDQPWRPRLAMPKIVEQIGRNLGLQFEPRVVKALCDAVEGGLDAGADPPAFVSHLENAFDPAIVREMLRELRRQITAPSLRPAATVIEGIGESGSGR